jgi:outer membrane protein
MRILYRIARQVAPLSSVSCLCISGWAQAPPNKVGIISVQGAILGTKEGQKAARQLEAKFQPKQKEFDQRQSELAHLQEQLEKEATILSEEKKSRLARDVEQKKKTLERDMSDAKDDLTAEQQRLLQTIGQRMMDTIEKYSKEKGYSLVLDVSNPGAPVVFASSAIDITQDIVLAYDQADLGAAGLTSSPSPPPVGTKTQHIR